MDVGSFEPVHVDTGNFVLPDAAYVLHCTVPGDQVGDLAWRNEVTGERFAVALEPSACPGLTIHHPEFPCPAPCSAVLEWRPPGETLWHQMWTWMPEDRPRDTTPPKWTDRVVVELRRGRPENNPPGQPLEYLRFAVAGVWDPSSGWIEYEWASGHKSGRETAWETPGRSIPLIFPGDTTPTRSFYQAISWLADHPTNLVIDELHAPLKVTMWVVDSAGNRSEPRTATLDPNHPIQDTPTQWLGMELLAPATGIVDHAPTSSDFPPSPEP